MSSVRDAAARPPVAGWTRLSQLAETVPIVRRLWLGATAYQYRRARRVLERGQVSAFALREGHAHGVSDVAKVYTLRESGLRVALRHGSSDSGVLEEIFN